MGLKLVATVVDIVCLYYFRLSASTHPVYASLDHPLFAARKEGGFLFLLFFFPSPLSAEGEERGDERSDVGVSNHLPAPPRFSNYSI
ncbi:hypothetical protein [Mucilaginibacter sp. UYCu711]|uniref:hypothetical protein n=1 Tax=Mucilaginibacter sp. UYCu711 TaxID=3156339 RepID=UPI003D231439